jgi:hypothetical protein
MHVKYKVVPLICIVIVALCADVSRAQKDTATISVLMATGMPGSTYYQAGLGMASLWTTKLKDMGIRVSAAISEGSIENIEAIRIADADMILVDNLFGSLAHKGEGIFKGKAVPELQAIGVLWPDIMHFLVRSNKVVSGTIEDLQNLNVAVELQDSGSKYIADILFKNLKSTRKKPLLKPLTNTAAAEALKRGQVQGLIMMGGLPIPVIATLFAETKPPVSLLEILDNQIPAGNEEFKKYFFRHVIPENTYPGQVSNAYSIGQMSILGVAASLDREVVYELTKTLFENVDQLAKAHPACSNVSLEQALEGLTIPVHNGALQYYREKNMKPLH